MWYLLSSPKTHDRFQKKFSQLKSNKVYHLVSKFLIAMITFGLNNGRSKTDVFNKQLFFHAVHLTLQNSMIIVHNEQDYFVHH